VLRDERSLPQMVLLSLFRVKFIIYPCQKRWMRETRARATHHPHTSSCHTPPSSQKFVHRSGTRRRFADTHREVPKPHLQVSGFRLETGSHPRGHQSFAQTGPAVDLYSPVATLSSPSPRAAGYSAIVAAPFVTCSSARSLFLREPRPRSSTRPHRGRGESDKATDSRSGEY